MVKYLKRLKDAIFRRIQKSVQYVSKIGKLLRLRTIYRLRIMDTEHTIWYIKENKCSIARYGDGEFNLMLQESGIGFQDRSPELANCLAKTLQSNNANLLICIPWSFNHLRYRNAESKRFWVDWATCNDRQERIVRHIWKYKGKKYLFGDAQITRPYIAMETAERAEIIFPMLQSIWDGRDLMFVEGEFTRMGVGNDLFSNARSILRILAPARNAFDFYEQIVESVCENYNGQLVLLALGPTATVIAEKLTDRGIQALDIGHIDVEYEWYLRRTSTRVKLNSKYTNEVDGGNCVDDCNDSEYLKQIIARIGC